MRGFRVTGSEFSTEFGDLGKQRETHLSKLQDSFDDRLNKRLEEAKQKSSSKKVAESNFDDIPEEWKAEQRELLQGYLPVVKIGEDSKYVSFYGGLTENYDEAAIQQSEEAALELSDRYAKQNNGVAGSVPVNGLNEPMMDDIIKEGSKKTAKAEPHKIPGTNLYIEGFGKDVNGNSVVYVSTPNQRRTSIQIVGDLPATDSAKAVGMEFFDTASLDDIKEVEQEILNYVKNYGSGKLKEHFQEYGKEASKKQAVIFDGYSHRVTIESKAGDNNQTYSTLTNMLSAADIRYREIRRYTVDPDRVMMDILVTEDDIDVIKELDKEGKEYNISFTFNDNISEEISPREIVTPEKEVEEKVTASRMDVPNIKLKEDQKDNKSAKEFLVDMDNKQKEIIKRMLLDQEYESITDNMPPPQEIRFYEFIAHRLGLHDFTKEYDNKPFGEFLTALENYVKSFYYVEERVTSSKKFASNLSSKQLEFLLRWANWDVNYGPVSLKEFAETENMEEVFNSLPKEMQNEESLKEDIGWADVESIKEIKAGYNDLSTTDMASGHRVHLLYPAEYDDQLPKAVLNALANRMDEEDYETIMGEKPEDEDWDDYFVQEQLNIVMGNEGFVFIDPFDNQGSVFEFLGQEMFKDEEGNVYI